MREWKLIKNIFSRIKVLKSGNSSKSQKWKDINEKKWEYLGVYHTLYSKKVYEENKKLIRFAENCNFITENEADSFLKLAEYYKVQARHAVYVEKFKNEKCYIYKFICKTTKENYLGQCNMEVTTIEKKEPHYVSCSELLIQLNEGQFEKDYNKMENCYYLKKHFDPVSRILEFEEEVKKAQAEGKILYQEDITSAMWMEDTLYSYISLKIYKEEGSYETVRNLELDKFMKNPETYITQKNKLNKVIGDLNKNELEEENVTVTPTSKLMEE